MLFWIVLMLYYPSKASPIWNIKMPGADDPILVDIFKVALQDRIRWQGVSPDPLKGLDNAVVGYHGKAKNLPYDHPYLRIGIV